MESLPVTLCAQSGQQNSGSAATFACSKHLRYTTTPCLNENTVVYIFITAVSTYLNTVIAEDVLAADLLWIVRPVATHYALL